MGFRVDWQGRDLWVYTRNEAAYVTDSIFGAMDLPVPEGCGEASAEMRQLLGGKHAELVSLYDAQMRGTPTEVASASNPTRNAFLVPIQWDDGYTDPLWSTDAVLVNILNANGGLVVPFSWRADITRAMELAAMLRSGRCAPGTRWVTGALGLTAITAPLAIFLGWLLVKDKKKWRSKRRRRRR